MLLNVAPDLDQGLAYSIMVEEILASIADGQLAVGSRIPSEARLKEQYGISITSIKRGLGVLVEKGVLIRRRGSGTYVANNVTSRPKPLVRRDTIAILRAWKIQGHHPFYTEQYRGILAGLAKHGLKVLDLQHRATMTRSAEQPGCDISYCAQPPRILSLELERHPEVAGMICTQTADIQLDKIAARPDFIVKTGRGPDYPYVAYDWAAEFIRMLRMALAKGARSLAVLSTLSQEDFESLSQKVIAEMGFSRKGIEMKHYICGKRQELAIDETHDSTAVAARAYQLTLDIFNSGPAIDGLVIGDDFCAQGVTDALVQVPREKWQGLPLVAHLNKESRLHSHIPMTAIVSDGYAHGIALADHMHEQITTGGHCAWGITMNCHEVCWR